MSTTTSRIGVSTQEAYSGFVQVTETAAVPPIVRSLEESILRTGKEQPTLLSIGASERSITHRIAHHLEDVLSEADEFWHVDCEYNRRAAEEIEPGVRTYVAKALPATGRQRLVYPDVIVHRRGKVENLLAVEIKILGRAYANESNILRDLDKLRLFQTEPTFGFREAILVLFDARRSSWELLRFDGSH